MKRVKNKIKKNRNKTSGYKLMLMKSRMAYYSRL